MEHHKSGGNPDAPAQEVAEEVQNKEAFNILMVRTFGHSCMHVGPPLLAAAPVWHASVLYLSICCGTWLACQHAEGLIMSGLLAQTALLPELPRWLQVSV